MKPVVFMTPHVLVCVLLLSGGLAPVKDVVGLPQRLGTGTPIQISKKS